MPRPSVGNINKRPIRPTFLREWRKYRGYTLEKAAEMIGVVHSTLGRIERSELPYSQQLLEAAADAYGCEASDLLSVNPTIPREVDILDAYRKAGPERKAILLDVLGARSAGKR